MRKLFYIGFALVLAMGVGCAVTDYEVITDNNQTAVNKDPKGIAATVNTAGKAHIRESSQIATIWPDGTDELIWFVDQKVNGDQTLLTYNNYTPGAYPNPTDPTFHDDLYCNADHSGCALVTAPNPFIGDTDMFDYTYNINCLGIRSLSVLVGTTRYYGECGKAKMTLADRIKLMNIGTMGRSLGVDGLFYNMNHRNLTLTLDNNAGYISTLPITADAQMFIGQFHKGYVDMTNPLMASMGRTYADFLANHATHHTTVTLTYEGISTSLNIAGNYGISSPSKVLGLVNQHY